MPKTRRSNTVSNTATTLDNRQSRELLEMAQRVNQRLNGSNALDIPMYSSSRSRNEMVHVTFDENTPGIANAISGSGRTYHVNYEEESCNCINHRTRGVRCRHIQAVQQARGLLNNNSESADSLQGAMPRDVDEVTQQIDDQEENQRRELTANVEEYDDEFFYTDEENESLFRELMRKAKRKKLPYEYENVLSGSQNTFGIELEFVDGNADAIARELYNLGICAHGRRVGYHAPSVAGKWKVERDGSVSSGSKGGELVSPVLKDTPETWRTIETICKVAKRHGAKINHKCGGHVHVGIEPLNTARQRWRRFFRAIGGFEDVLYRLSGGSEGRIRSGYTHYATPFAANARRSAVERFSLNDRDDINYLTRRASGQSRYHSINLTNIYQSNRPNTVEFRGFNGALDPAVIQANVKIANGIMMASEKARTQDTSDIQVSEAMKKRGRMLRNHPLRENSHQDHTAIKKFVDIVFTRKKDKDAIIGLYAKNQWAV
jgi:hypothetical protein